MSIVTGRDFLAILLEGTEPFADSGALTGRMMSDTDRAVANRQVWEELIANLLDLRSLEDDWDGQGAKAPPQDLVDSAIKLACLLRDNRVIPAHYAIASVNGTVHLEWVKAHRSLDVEIIAPGLAEVCPVDLHADPVAFGVYRW